MGTELWLGKVGMPFACFGQAISRQLGGRRVLPPALASGPMGEQWEAAMTSQCMLASCQSENPDMVLAGLLMPLEYQMC